MKRCLIISFLSLRVLFSYAQLNVSNVTEMIVKNVSVISMVTNEVKEHQDVVIKDGKISSISDSSKYMISGFDMVGKMKLIKNAELSNYDILRMATINLANFFNENYGSIEVGKAADFIVLSTNPLEDLKASKKIEGLYFNNQFLDSERLNSMRKELLETAQN